MLSWDFYIKIINKMLKKFSDFTNEKIGCNVQKTDKTPVQTTVQKSQKTPNLKEPKEPKLKDKKISEPKVMENFEFVGKVVKFPSRIRPSISIVMLENNNVSKDKLHYIISKQTNDSLVLLKYNEKTQIKLTEFVTTLITYYKRNQQLKSAFEKIVVEGNDSFSIIKNIPNINLGEKSLIQVLNDDLVKLLK